jgi:cytidine deaminase
MELDKEKLTEEQWKTLSRAAWGVRENAYILGDTRVGSAALTADGSIFLGCNVEHRYRSHDLHAEFNAIGSMVAAGHTDLIAIFVAAERERFTPCGSCMDWILQFGGPSCMVGYQSSESVEIKLIRADDLMPYYPI